MTKVQIKSEKLTSFGGLFSIMEQFDSTFSSVIDSLGRKCSLMATPSKRDSVNAQSKFKFRSVDSQTISF